MKKSRIWELDFLKGFAIIMMIFDHILYDLKNLSSLFSNFFELNIPLFNWLNEMGKIYWFSELRFFGQLFFISLFLVISGINFTLSKSNLRRGIKLLIVSIIISIFTFLIEFLIKADVFIVFGIIHMYAICILLIYLFRKIYNNELFIFILGTIIIIIGFVFEFWNYNYISNIKLVDIPELIIGTKAYGSDSFGIIPYLGVMMLGTVIGNSIYNNKLSLIPIKNRKGINIVKWFGKNSLIIFLTHQVILYIFILGLGYLFGYRI